MKIILLLLASMLLSGCFGYKLISRTELAFISQANQTTGYLKCVNNTGTNKVAFGEGPFLPVLEPK